MPPVPATDSPASPPSLLTQTRQTLQQALQRYTVLRPSARETNGNPALATTRLENQSRLEQLESLNTRLTSHTLRVAVFGLVSRGKSAVINALLGKPVLETGPLHGVTQWPRSVYWQPPAPQSNTEDPWQIEFVDTPGLDEIDGAARAGMAQTVAQQVDLILFVVAGDITHTEYAALQQLQAAQKPLLLVFNKIDLYPG
ncbi:MAG: 50S ribosome-binding GTPase, partial [Cyanobacteria bacterium Co-bin13]|nr:50S ribosome-binding GTPase [Cyanobacteria bacterium Co-bin13]